VILRFAPHISLRDAVQLVVDELNQPIERFAIAAAHARKEHSDRFRYQMITMKLGLVALQKNKLNIFSVSENTNQWRCLFKERHFYREIIFVQF